jgi:enterochelin esterase-like enzyme
MPARILLIFGLFAPLLVLLPPASAQLARVTPRELQEILSKPITGTDGEMLEKRMQSTFGIDTLKSGVGAHRTEGPLVMWAIETLEPTPRVQQAGNIRSWGMTPLPNSHLWVAVAPVPNPSLVAYQFEAGGKRFGGGAIQMEYYPRHPDTFPQEGLPKGTVTQARFESKVFERTARDYWVYVPAQYQPEKPAAVMVFQDGGAYLNAPVYGPTVFDNLIGRGEMPVTVAVFVNPGAFADGRSNRSFEYDTLSDRYARFLRDELVPEVAKKVKLTDDPERRAICGISSGGICAWTAAWQMPDYFRKVLSHVGSFVDIASGPTLREGGHNYPALIRKTPKKPIRVWLQEGSNDLNNEHGNWPLANQEMASSLSFMGYDYRFDYGQGFHSILHGAATFPDSLRWLWRDVR